jgi:hypothetical protein
MRFRVCNLGLLIWDLKLVVCGSQFTDSDEGVNLEGCGVGIGFAL